VIAFIATAEALGRPGLMDRMQLIATNVAWVA
jgi:hypothetical protein